MPEDAHQDASTVLQIPPARRPRRIAAAITVVTLLAAVILAGAELERYLTAAESWISSAGPWGTAAFMVLFVVSTSLLVPDTILGAAAGVLFGLWWGMVVAVVGSVLAAALQYWLSRGLLRVWIQRTFGARPALRALQRAVWRHEFRLQVLLRLTPINPATVSYVLGAAGVRFWGFLLACVALTPHLFFEVYLGRASSHVVHSVAGSRSIVLEDAPIIGGLVAAATTTIVLSRLARRAVTEAVDEVGQTGRGGTHSR